MAQPQWDLSFLPDQPEGRRGKREERRPFFERLMDGVEVVDEEESRKFFETYKHQGWAEVLTGEDSPTGEPQILINDQKFENEGANAPGYREKAIMFDSLHMMKTNTPKEYKTLKDAAESDQEVMDWAHESFDYEVERGEERDFDQWWDHSRFDQVVGGFLFGGDEQMPSMKEWNRDELPFGDNFRRELLALERREFPQQPPEGGWDLSFLPNQPKDPEPVTFGERFGGGIDTLQKLSYDFADWVGEVVGSGSLEEWAEEGSAQQQEELDELGPREGFFEEDSWMPAHRSFGELTQFFKELVGEMTPLLAPSLAMGAAGAAIGTAILPGAGTLFGAVAGTIGGAIGAFIPAFVMGVGEVQGNLRAEGVEAPMSAFIGGSAIAALDTVLPGKIGARMVRAMGRETAEEVAQRMLSKALRPGMLRRMGREGAAGLRTEGITEAFQEAVGEIATAKGVGRDIDWAALPKMMAESGIAGGVMGFLGGGAAGVQAPRRPGPPPPPEADVQPDKTPKPKPGAKKPKKPKAAPEATVEPTEADEEMTLEEVTSFEAELQKVRKAVSRAAEREQASETGENRREEARTGEGKPAVAEEKPAVAEDVEPSIEKEKQEPAKAEPAEVAEPVEVIEKVSKRDKVAPQTTPDVVPKSVVRRAELQAAHEAKKTPKAIALSKPRIKKRAAEVQAFTEGVKEELGLDKFQVFQSSAQPNVLELSDIEVAKAERKGGVGTQAMERLVAFADQRGQTVVLSPATRADGGTTSRARLVKFYKRFGFVQNKGAKADHSLPIQGGMYRLPKTAKQADVRVKAAQKVPQDVKTRPSAITTKRTQTGPTPKAKLEKAYGVTGGNRFQRVVITEGGKQFTYDIKTREGQEGSQLHTGKEAKALALEQHQARAPEKAKTGKVKGPATVKIDALKDSERLALQELLDQDEKPPKTYSQTRKQFRAAITKFLAGGKPTLGSNAAVELIRGQASAEESFTQDLGKARGVKEERAQDDIPFKQYDVADIIQRAWNTVKQEFKAIEVSAERRRAGGAIPEDRVAITSWRGWLEVASAEEIATVIENNYDIYKMFLQGMPEDMTFVEVINAFKAGALEPGATATGVTTPAIELEAEKFRVRARPGEPVAATEQSPQAIQTKWVVAKLRVTEKNRQAVLNARKGLLIQTHVDEGSVVDALGISSSELAKQFRGWANYSQEAMEFQRSINADTPLISHWTGIQNLSWLNTATLVPSDVEAFVEKVDGTNSFLHPLSEKAVKASEYLSGYITRALLGLDSRIDYTDLSFEVADNMAPLGRYDPSRTNIEVRQHHRHTVAHEIGHYLDNTYAREIDMGRSDYASELGPINEKTLKEIAERTSPERAQWIKRFSEFVFDISMRADISSSYTQARPEVFARFIAKFVEWTETQAGVKPYKEEARYHDHFGRGDFLQYVELLKEKALIDQLDGNPHGKAQTHIWKETHPMRFAPARFQNGGRLVVSARAPFGTKAVETNEVLRSDLAAVQGDDAAEWRESAAALLRKFDILTPEQQKGNADEVIAASIVVWKNNLRSLYDNAFTAEVRDRAKKWYEGAHRLAVEQAEQHGINLEQASAVFAVLSPQQDWYVNAEEGIRLMKAFFEWGRAKNPYFTAGLQTKARSVLHNAAVASNQQNGRKGDAAAAYLANADRMAETMLEKYGGRRWDSMPDHVKAVMIRVHDELTNTRDYPLILPEGERVGHAGNFGWFAFGPMAKAISVLEDGSVENINRQLGGIAKASKRKGITYEGAGGNHKVRSFFNNINDPDDINFVTIDTHAVAAAYYSAYSQSDPEANRTMSTPAAVHMGIDGLNPLIAEAYFQLARELGVKPRELQSVTWEAGRALFRPEAKRGNLTDLTRALWREFQQGKIGLEDLHAQINDAAKDAKTGVVFQRPSWADTRPGTSAVEGGVAGRADVADGGGLPATRGALSRGAQGISGELARQRTSLERGPGGSVVLEEKDVVTRAELEIVAEARGTTVEVEAARARKAGYEVPDMGPAPKVYPTPATETQDFDPDDYFNFRRVAISEEEKTHLREALIEVVKRTGRVPKEVVTFDDIRSDAAALGPEVVEKLAPFQQEQQEYRAVRHLVRQRINQLNAEVAAERKALIQVPEERSLMAESELNTKEENLHGLLDTWMRMRSEDGRNLAMHRMMAEQTFDVAYWIARAHRSLGQPAGSQLPANVYQKITEITARGDQAETEADVKKAAMDLSKFVTNLERTGWLEGASLMRKAGLLTSIRTTTRNVGGNTTFQILEEIARVPSVAVDMVLAGATGTRTVQGMSVTAFNHSTYEAATKGWESAKAAMRGEQMTPHELLKVGAMREMNTGVKWLDSYVNFVFRFMSAQDRIFKSYAFRRSMEEQSYLRAINTGVDPVHLLANPTKEMVMHAMADAEFATFNNKSMAGGMVRQGQAWAKRRGIAGEMASFGVDIVIPYANTPSNLLARLLDYTVLGVMGHVGANAYRAWADKAMAPAHQRAIAQAIGRGLTGLPIIYFGWAMAAAGMATSSGGEEPRGEAEVGRAAGRIGGSILGWDGKWHVIAPFSPIGNLITVGATMQRSATAPLSDEAGRVGKLAAVVGRVMIDQPMLRGAKDVVDSLSRPGSTGERVLGSTVGSFIPTFISDLAAVFDPYRRQMEPEGWGDAMVQGVQARTPGWRNSLPPRMDVLGKEQPQTLRAIWDATISTDARELDDEVLAALIDNHVGVNWPQKWPGEPAAAYRERARLTGLAVEAAVKRGHRGATRLRSPVARREALQKLVTQGKARARASTAYKILKRAQDQLERGR